MEQLLEIAARLCDQAEVYSQTVAKDEVTFENGRLKEIESRVLSGTALRIIQDGRLGMTCTRRLRDRLALVDAARLTLSAGAEAPFDLPRAVTLPELRTADEEIDRLSTTGMVDECARVAEALRTGPEGDRPVNVRAVRTVTVIRLMNSRGVDYSARLTSYTSTAWVLFPGGGLSLERTVAGRGFVPFPDTELAFLRDTYAPGCREVPAPVGAMNALFLPPALSALLEPLREGTMARNVFERTSPLVNRIGEPVVSEKLTITSAALDDTRPGARAFDDEGTPGRNLPLVERGVLRNFYSDLYYGHKLNLPSTGNGFRPDLDVGPQPSVGHLQIEPGTSRFAELLKLLGRGLIVAGTVGAFSGNMFSGDYSFGLGPGLLVEHGEIQGRVLDAMAAGNAYEALNRVVALEDTAYQDYAKFVPAILVEGVNIATKV